MRKLAFEIRVFRCPECGNLNYAAKRTTRRTPAGHVKDMWCPFCKQVRKFVQVE